MTVPDYVKELEKEKRKKFLDLWNMYYERNGYGLVRTAKEMGITLNQIKGLVWKYHLKLRNRTLAVAKRFEIDKKKRYDRIKIKNIGVYQESKKRMQNFWDNYRKEHEEYIQLKKRVEELEKQQHEQI